MRQLWKRYVEKKWSQNEIKKYLGDSTNAYLSYASDENIRTTAASGGTTTAILIYALRKNLIDGVLVCRTIISDHKIRGEFFIATNEHELLSARGSIYISVNFSNHTRDLLCDFNGKLAIVGLPCTIKRIKNLEKNNLLASGKIVFTIALFCGHTSNARLIDIIAEKLEKEAKSEIKRFYFRVGLWRGNLRAEFHNGTVLEKKSSYYNIYQNLFFYADKKCFFCHDHFGYNADISLGDTWLYSLRKKDIKYNSVLTRNMLGKQILSDVHRNHYCVLENCTQNIILNGQKRTAPTHYNTTAKHYAGKFLNIKIPDTVKEKTSLRELLIAWLLLMNWKWSQTKNLSKLIFWIPSPLLKGYLYFLKALESLK